ncbi:MAG: DUF6515 family protein [Bacteroidales bacterium]|jgi:hypothetical protein|nr:DUF6515 family protein [Bacteroidales bacterium]
MKKIEKVKVFLGILVPCLLMFSFTAGAQSNYRRSDKNETRKDIRKYGSSAKSRSRNSVYVPSGGIRKDRRPVKIYNNGGHNFSSGRNRSFRPEPRPSVHHNYGKRFNSLPGRPVVIHRGGTDYYFAEGRYFLRRSGAYFVCRPPVGAIVAVPLLRGALHLTDYVVRSSFGIRQRYYTDDDGVYYIKSGNVFIVVDPPVGAILYQLPAGYGIAEINGTSYYVVGDSYYIADVDSFGRPFFRYAGSLSRY